MFCSNVPNLLSDPSLMQQLQQTIQKTNEQMTRQKVLQQQQAEFDQQIGQVRQEFCILLIFDPLVLSPEGEFRSDGIELHVCTKINLLVKILTLNNSIYQALYLKMAKIIL